MLCNTHYSAHLCHYRIQLMRYSNTLVFPLLMLRLNKKMITLGLIVSFVLCSLYVCIEAVRNGMAKKRWLMAGLIMGPMMLPMFQISKKMALRKASGFENSFFQA